MTAAEKMKKTTTALVFGNFNVIHPGYLRMFRHAKQLADKLVVGVLCDTGDRALQPFDQVSRLENVRANMYVDDVQLVEVSMKQFIEELKPDFLIKGKEHEGCINPEEDWVAKFGGSVVYTSGEALPTPIKLKENSSKSLITHVKLAAYNFTSQAGIQGSDILAIIDQFKNKKVCVIGDIIVDKNIHCHALGMSQEDPTLVVSPYEEKMFLGGAGVVAGHVSSMGADVDFISVVGNDSEASFALDCLESQKINAQVFVDTSRPTTLKTRFKAKGKTLLRVSKLSQASISFQIQSEIIKYIKKNVEKYDLFIFSDFNYGCIPDPLLNKIQSLLAKSDIVTVADSQSSSQIGNTTRFQNMSLLCCTEHEARVSLRDMECGLGVLIEKLQASADPSRTLLKLGKDGVILSEREQVGQAINNSIPTFNENPIDVSGAGDSMMVASGLSLTTGASFLQAAFLGTLTAAIQIGIEGNVPITSDALKEYIINGSLYARGSE